MRKMVAVLGALALLLPVAGYASDESGLSWLVGNWRTEPGLRTETSEHWQPMKDEMMAGVSTSVRGGKTVSTEKMEIILDKGVLMFRASPDGAAPTEFPEAAHDATSITFENASHDYPQRIRYWREGEVLMAEISLIDGSKPMRWKYRKVAGN